MKTKPKSGVVILVGGKFNKKIIHDIEVLNSCEYNIYSITNIPSISYSHINCNVSPKLYKYTKTEQSDRHGRVIYEYVNKRVSTGDGVLSEFKNNKEVVILEERFRRIKRDIETNGADYNPHVKDAIMTEYNDILKKLMAINNKL